MSHNVENFFRPKETKEPRIEKPVFDKPVFGAVPEQLWRDLIHAFEPTMKPNPIDPYHVLLDLIKDLHADRLIRQNKLVEVTENRDSLMREVERLKAEVARKKDALRVLEELKQRRLSPKTSLAVSTALVLLR